MVSSKTLYREAKQESHPNNSYAATSFEASSLSGMHAQHPRNVCGRACPDEHEPPRSQDPSCSGPAPPSPETGRRAAPVPPQERGRAAFSVMTRTRCFGRLSFSSEVVTGVRDGGCLGEAHRAVGAPRNHMLRDGRRRIESRDSPSIETSARTVAVRPASRSTSRRNVFRPRGSDVPHASAV